MNNKPSVLIVEDETQTSSLIAEALRENGYRPLLAENGRAAMSMISSHCPDVVLLNLGLPDMDGLDVLRFLRKWSAGIPVLIISGRSAERDKVRALDTGADDYIVKPFGCAELVARIRTAMRHSIKMESGRDVVQGTLTVGGVTVDFNRRCVLVAGENRRLTQNEFKIVSLLATHSGQVLSYSYIIGQIWGRFAADNRQILRVNVANIRRKMERDPAHPRIILTKAGVGYQMGNPPPDASARISGCGRA